MLSCFNSVLFFKIKPNNIVQKNRNKILIIRHTIDIKVRLSIYNRSNLIRIGLRNYLVRYWRKYIPIKIQNWVVSNRPWLSTTIRAALASSIAWELALNFAKAAPATAALAALFTAQANVVGTLKQAAYRVVGILVGVLVATALQSFTSLGGLLIFGVLLISIGIGLLLRLGKVGSLQIPINALIILEANKLSEGILFISVSDAILGIVTGIIVAAVLLPPVPVRPAVYRLLLLGKAQSELLTSMAVFCANPSKEDGNLLLARARLITDTQLTDSTLASQSARESLKLHPSRLVVDEMPQELAVSRLEHANLALSHTTHQLRGIARALDDSASMTLPEAPRLEKFFSILALAINSYVELFGENSGDDLSGIIEYLKDAKSLLSELLCSYPSFVEIDESDLKQSDISVLPFLIMGTILSDSARVLRELDPIDGPHSEAFQSMG